MNARNIYSCIGSIIEEKDEEQASAQPQIFIPAEHTPTIALFFLYLFCFVLCCFTRFLICFIRFLFLFYFANKAHM